MLKKLTIQNYAIINEIAIEFSPYMNTITGETGAGKSILMGALSLILGERADSSVLVQKDKKCTIEGLFSVENKLGVALFLQEQDIDEEAELILRREIGVNGKSRAFINDSPATLQQLKQLSALLVDLHQQFDTLELGDTAFQRTVIDALAGNELLLGAYRKKYRAWAAIYADIRLLEQQKLASLKEYDYHLFLFNELDQLSLKENELELLTEELKLLGNAEGIKASLAKIYAALNESETPIVSTLKQLSSQLSSVQHLLNDAEILSNRIKATQIELQDIGEEIDRLNNSIQFDEKRIEWINERLSDGYKLLKKHGATTTTELLLLHQSFSNQLNSKVQLDELIAARQKEADLLLSNLKTSAKIMGEAREKSALPFEKSVNQLLAKVGMPNARIKVNLTPVELYEFGKEQVDIFFDANKSNRFEPIRKVASGGELSRLMLCIKSLVAACIDLPTLIFDEIDTGISGEAAKQVGLIMQQMADQRQIICITHQPQIAGKAHAHYFVYKEQEKNTVKTNIRLLTKEERITAIAQMLSGEKPTAAALENAREMMG
ncbi:MAG: DNA repair protein RecN [Sphingobacteriia bacterium]|nr:MAG: DNA repair protein RecN [Sphingobacteriia bacterium]TAH09039.1 MAG: DNA repair protein RecN [Sphingobacteriia bacterium]